VRTLHQPLDERWAESSGCLHGQSAWPAYRCLSGVLARDEDEAHRLAAAQQAECYDLEATVERVEELAQTYTDNPASPGEGLVGAIPKVRVISERLNRGYACF
jgi:hypothetical protein